MLMPFCARIQQLAQTRIGIEGDMSKQPTAAPAGPAKGFPFLAASVLTAAVFGCSIYANLAFVVTNSANYRYFPPFKPYVNANMSRHLGAEYFNIAQSMVAGEGFANPFGEH